MRRQITILLIESLGRNGSVLLRRYRKGRLTKRSPVSSQIAIAVGKASSLSIASQIPDFSKKVGDLSAMGFTDFSANFSGKGFGFLRVAKTSNLYQGFPRLHDYDDKVHFQELALFGNLMGKKNHKKAIRSLNRRIAEHQEKIRLEYTKDFPEDKV